MPEPIPATFAIPQEPTAPLEIEFRHEALYLSVVDRDQWASKVASHWSHTGIYLLFGPPSDDAPGHYSVYVGKAAPGTIQGRIKSHVKKKESWDRSVLVRRTTTAGFNSTDVGWLEGELHQRLVASPFAEVLNSVKPGDDTLSQWDRESLARVVTLIQGVLRVLGYRSDPVKSECGSNAEPAVEHGETFSTEAAHAVIALVAEGEWTTYGDVAEVLNSHPNGIGSHIRNCKVADGTPEWRVLNRRGESSPGFVWTTSPHKGTQLEVLVAEGVKLIDETRADPDQRIDADELSKRIGADSTAPIQQEV